MQKNVLHKFISECPHLKRNHSIQISYVVIPIAGRTDPGYKRMSYSCDLYDECEFPKLDPYGRCPVFLKSPDEPS